MPKNVLKLDDDDYDFVLIGIVTSHRDYRVTRDVNLALGITLERKEDYLVFEKKRGQEIGFPHFKFVNEQEDQYYILGNKTENGLLIPEQRQMDFFLVVKSGMSDIDRSALVKSLKEIDQFQAVFPIEVAGLRSKENLLF
ncbi:MAG: hypothetical protein RL021_1613 [Bacteroidota bacterium]|jgi:hypothetical protein